MISRSHDRRNPNRVPGKPWQPPRVPDTIWHNQQEGTITESIQDNQLSVTVKLQRTYAVMMGEAGDTAEFRKAFKTVHSVWRFFDGATKLLALCAVLYLAYRIVPAFMPGGAAYNLLEGNQ
jgi:hypothetical protein